MSLPDDAPTFGNRVLISKPPQGIFVCWDPKSMQGAYIASVRPNGNVSIVVASAPVPWPHED
eukprot:12937375-Prorocentrum_lima.AAC.1